MVFTTPFILSSVTFSLLYILFVRRERLTRLSPLPPYPDQRFGGKLFLIVGELHHAKRPETVRAAVKRWNQSKTPASAVTRNHRILCDAAEQCPM
jgi:hypothetical protein